MMDVGYQTPRCLPDLHRIVPRSEAGHNILYSTIYSTMPVNDLNCIARQLCHCYLPLVSYHLYSGKKKIGECVPRRSTKYRNYWTLSRIRVRFEIDSHILLIAVPLVPRWA